MEWSGIPPQQFNSLVRTLFLTLTWVVVVAYTVGGLHDIFYDISNYVIRLFRRFFFRKRPRLTLARLKAMEQQAVAVFIPAWSEADVIDKMIDNILRRVEYDNFVIFVGTYPNDPATQQAVDALAAEHRHVVKVVTARPGPTSKADCLNNVYEAMAKYEAQHGINFDIICMHDAEDFVHPYEFLLFNYLIPRVDAVQTPILPLPVENYKWIHWVYADEFAENHMKDVVVREMTSGFVPFAGVATGFSRRSFRIIQSEFGDQIFNEESLTEDYSLGKRMRDLGMHTAFVNVVLKDDTSPWYVPLSERKDFIASWAYFPMDFQRSVRQKTRWIMGINFQEWQQTGWAKDFWMDENLFKDRKGAIASIFNLLGYIVFFYFVLFLLHEWGISPLQLEPLVKEKGLFLYLLWFATGLMLVRAVQRIVIVTWVYGIVPGLLTIPRQFVANLINGIASYRAIQTYLRQRFRGERAHWEKTVHKEGVGAAPIDAGEVQRVAPRAVSFSQVLTAVYSQHIDTMVEGMRHLLPETNPKRQRALKQRLFLLVAHPDYRVRAALPRALAQLVGKNTRKYVLRLLFDRDWVVRANAARVIVNMPEDERDAIMKFAFRVADYYGRQVLLRAVENRRSLTETLRGLLETEEFASVRDWLLESSLLLSRASGQPHEVKRDREQNLGGFSESYAA